MQQNDGGSFGEDPLIRFIAKMQKGSVSEKDIQDQEQMKHDAINMAMGTAGTIRNVGAGVKLLPSAYDLEQEAFKKAAEKAPSFFQKYGPKDVTGPGGEVIPIDKFKAISELLKK
jgi:surface antigen